MKDKITYTVKEAAEIIGISRSLTYRLIKDNLIPNVRLGTRILIPKKRLEQFINEMNL